MELNDYYIRKITLRPMDKYSYELILENGNSNKFMIHYAGGDLYWTMLDYCDDNEFYISRDNEILFLQLKDLFYQIQNNNASNFKLLNNNCLEWISEAYGIPEESNRLIITKEENKFIIKFYLNHNRMFSRKDICAICFCLSGSKYQDIANAFSIMFYEYIESFNHKTRVLK